MPTREKKNEPKGQDTEQNVFSGTEEKRSPFKDDQTGSSMGNEDSASDEDAYRSRNLEIEKERD